MNQPQTPHLKYRSDIDGLRALAVLAVVAYHAFPNIIRGGFIGVDVFFVISGFLITSILIKDLKKNNTFNFFEFYSRRIKRIFPCLIIVMIFVYVSGWFLFSSSEFMQLGMHIFSGAVFISNFTLWNEVGYFSVDADTKPLLHLWSLSIEEQFYVLWPLLLFASFKLRITIFFTIAIAIISLLLNFYLVKIDSVNAFYSPFTRIWELLFGSILALIKIYQTSSTKNNLINFDHLFSNLTSSFKYVSAKKSNGVSVFGCFLLAMGFLIIDNQTPFPGYWALFPTIGTALIILAGTDAWINHKILSNPILVKIGIISYPLYLWHWPLLSIAKIVNSGVVPEKITRIFIILASILLAWITYYFIERPIRRKENKIKKILIILSVLMITIGFLGYSVYRGNGYPMREAARVNVENEATLGHDHFFSYISTNFFSCSPLLLLDKAPKFKTLPRCFQSKSDKQQNIAIIGDSHAEHLFIGLAENLPKMNIVYYINETNPVITDKNFQEIFNYVIEDKNISTIIFSAFWFRKFQDPLNGVDFLGALRKTIELLTKSNKKIYIIEDVPNFSFNPSSCVNKRKFAKEVCSENIELNSLERDTYYPLLISAVSNNKDVKILKIMHYFCSDKACNMNADGMLLYRDSHHLNINGSKYLGRLLVEDNPELSIKLQ